MENKFIKEVMNSVIKYDRIKRNRTAKESKEKLKDKNTNCIEVSNQKELNKIPLSFNGTINISGKNINIRRKYKNLRVIKNGSAYVFNNIEIESFDNSYIFASNNSYVKSYDNAKDWI